MTDKKLALEAIERLPPGATLLEIRQRIDFLAALRDAEDSLDRGEGVPHEQVEREFATWMRAWRTKSSGPGKRSKTSRP